MVLKWVLFLYIQKGVKMITCSDLSKPNEKISRLGNHMFMYALLYAVSKKNGFNICVEWREGKKYFNIPIRKTNDKIKNLFCSLRNYNNKAFLQPDNTDYYGFFMSENNFLDIRREILKLYTPKKHYYNIANSFLNKHNKHNKKIIVCHIRGGDYFKWGFPILNKDYYKQALKLIIKKDKLSYKDYVIVVIGDDKELMRTLFNGYPRVIFSNYEAIIDMILLMKADRCIISASTFAWWGAWLNNNKSKIIIAPKYWLNFVIGLIWVPSGIYVNNWRYIKSERLKGSGTGIKSTLKSIYYFNKYLIINYIRFLKQL
jgi:hypothetical protein